MQRAWANLPAYARRVLVRLAFLPLIWVIATMGVHWMLYEGKSDPAGMIAGQGASADDLATIHESLGLNKPVYEQYPRWLGNFVTGDWGEEYRSRRPIRSEVAQHFRPSAEFVVLTLSFASALTLGLLLAVRGRSGAHLSKPLAAGLASVPAFLVYISLIIVPISWGPSWLQLTDVGYNSFLDEPGAYARHMVLPALLTSLIATGSAIPATRALMAPGWRPTLGTCATIALGAATSTLPIALSATVLYEAIYSVGGEGQYLYRSILLRDLPVTQAVLALLLMVGLAGWVLSPGASRPRKLQSAMGPMAKLMIGLGLALVAALVVAGLCGAVVTSVPGLSPNHRLESPSLGHIFGTDRLGRDLFVQTIEAAVQSLRFAVVPLFAGFLPGAAVAALVGRLCPRNLSDWVREVASIWHALPLLPILLAFIVGFDPGLHGIAAAVTIGAFFTGLMLAPKLAACNRSKAEHWTHIAAVCVAGAMAMLSTTILAEATIGFLGLGSEPGTASWGLLISEGIRNGSEYPHLWMIPGVVFCAIPLGFNLIRRALDDVVPPEMYER